MQAAVLRVGLTGGTGAGKSTVAARLGALGAAVVDADALARQVLAPGSPGLAEVVETFGPGLVRPDGTLDRGALGRVVFADPERRRALEAITHPRVAELTRERFARARDDAVVVHDVPLLVEKDLGAGYHLVVVVGAPAQVRVDRLVGDRGMAAEDAWARVRAQAGDDQRRAAADVWLDNSGATDGLPASVDGLWRRLVAFEQHLRLRQLPERGDRVVLVAPDPSWPVTAVRLLARVARVTGTQVLRADHIGSTAVPGLEAKDVIDLQLVVPDLPAAAEVGEAVAGVGLLPRQGWWADDLLNGGEHQKVLAGSADPGRAVNLHIRELASPAWRETLALRDWLRSRPDQAAEYAALKQRIAAGGYEGVNDYARRKTGWIRAAVQAATAAGFGP